jgi:hypothetical protein
MNPTALAEPCHVELTGRRAYVARITGTDPRYGLSRDFARKVSSLKGRRGYWAKVTEPGWYELVTYGPAGKRIRYEGWDGAAWHPIPRELFAPFAAVAVTGPNPGAAGAWYGDRCQCGEPVDTYTPEGWPRCAQHTEQEPST